MANETLSPKQAKEILKQYQDQMNEIIKNIEVEYSKFLEILQNEWEDKYAKNFSDELIEKINVISNSLSDNCKVFADGIVKIEKDNMPEVMEINFKLPKTSIKSNVKEMFDENNFGFKNTDSPKIVYDALTNMVNKLTDINTRAVNNLRSLNVYGNDIIMQNIAISTGKTIEMLQNSIENIEEIAKKNIKDAAQEYAPSNINQ